MTDKSRKAVPREPTEAMIVCGWRGGNKVSHELAAEIWRSMYDAAPVLATAPSGERKALEELVALIEKRRWTCTWKGSEDEPAVERARAVLATAPAEPPKDDSLRMDWLGSGHMGHDLTICSPGNHGGSMLNWLLVVDTWGRGPEGGNREYEGATLREAIDAAMRDGIK